MSGAESRENTKRAGFSLMRPLLAGLLCLAALTPCTLLAQTGTAKATRPSNRCLLVVETSRSMQRRSDGVIQAVQDMLKSGLAGQLRPGDTLGVWTFNDSLYAGRFPLQTWSLEAQQGIALRTIAFLKAQKYEKQASFDKVLPALSRLIKDSPLLTIILVSSGDEQFHGTAFDAQINEFYQKWQDVQQKAKLPFVTVLRAQDGRLADFTVNTPPWPAQMPRLPQEVQGADTAQTQVPKAARTSPPPTAQPLIFSGNKTQPTEAPASKLEAVGAAVQAPAPATEAPSTNKSVTGEPLVSPPTPAQTAKAATAPVDLEKPSAGQSPGPAPAPLPIPETKPVAEPKVDIVKGPEMKPVAPAPLKVEAAPVLVTPAPRPTPAPTATPDESVGTAATRPVPADPPIVPAPPVQTATATPAGTLVGWPFIWIAGLGLAVAAIGIVFLLRRRSHATSGASLITQSFERKNKP